MASFDELCLRSENLRVPSSHLKKNPIHSFSSSSSAAAVSAAAAAVAAPESTDLLRTLDQVAARSIKLVERSINERSQNIAHDYETISADVVAQSFLANAGFNSEDHKNDLITLDLTNSLCQNPVECDHDVESFLNNHHNSLIIDTFEDAKTKTTWDSHILVQKILNRSWEATRRRLTIELAPQPSLSGIGLTTAMDAGIAQTSSSFMGSTASTTALRSLGGSSREKNTKRCFWPSSYGAVSACDPTPLTNSEYSEKSRGFCEAVNCMNLDFSCYKDDSIYQENQEELHNGHQKLPMRADNFVAKIARVPGQEPSMAETWRLLEFILKPTGNRPLSFAKVYLAGPKSMENQYSPQKQNYNTSLNKVEGYDTENTFQSSHEQLIRSFLDSARNYLEEAFYDFIEATIHRQPKASLAGGDPTVVRRVEAFVRFRYRKYDFWDLESPELLEFNTSFYEEAIPSRSSIEAHSFSSSSTNAQKSFNENNRQPMPAWTIIFFMLRCGKRAEAVEYAHSLKLHASDDYFPQFLNAWSAGSLTQELLGSVRAYHSSLVHTPNTDIYKIAVYKIIGRCDLREKRTDCIVEATEDWLWLRLTLLQHSSINNNLQHSVQCSVPFELEDYVPINFQKEILTLESHFATQSPFKYVNMLLSGALFEKAVAYLYRFPQYQIEALHLALLLHYFGCLRTPVDLKTVQWEYKKRIRQSQINPMDISGGGSFTGSTRMTEEELNTSFTEENSNSYQSFAVPLHAMVALHLTRIGVGEQAPYIARCAHYWHYDKNEYSEWLCWTRETMIQWIRRWPMTIPIEIDAAYLRMLGFTGDRDFRLQIVGRAAEQARDEDQLEAAIYLFSQAGEEELAYETLASTLARVFLHGPQFLGRSLNEIILMAENVLGDFLRRDHHELQVQPEEKKNNYQTNNGEGSFGGGGVGLLVGSSHLSAPGFLHKSGARNITALLVSLLKLKIPGIRTSEAWQIVEATRLVPLSEESVEDCVNRCNSLLQQSNNNNNNNNNNLDQGFSNYWLGNNEYSNNQHNLSSNDYGIAQLLGPCYAPLLSISMDLSAAEYVRVGDTRFVIAAQSLVRFAGLVNLRLDPELHAYLAQRAAEMSKMANFSV